MGSCHHHGRAQWWGRAGKGMYALPNNPGRCPDPGTTGVERGCSAHVAKPDSSHPKNSKWHHPSLAHAAVLAGSGTNRARAGAIGANAGLAAMAVPWLGSLWKRSHSQRVRTPWRSPSPPAGRQAKPKPALLWSTHVRHHHPEHLHRFLQIYPPAPLKIS